MFEFLIDEATNLGFFCLKDAQERWKITSSSSRGRWQLEQVEDNEWLFVLNGLPEMYLLPEHALKLLYKTAKREVANLI